jgi:hypothetical protein
LTNKLFVCEASINNAIEDFNKSAGSVIFAGYIESEALLIDGRDETVLR